MQNHLNKKVVVVTGAASGFGKLVASKCLDLGAMVTRCDVNKVGLSNTKDDFREYTANLLDFTADVTNLERTAGRTESSGSSSPASPGYDACRRRRT